MTDLSIRRMTLAEQAEAAARRHLSSGEPEPNPHAGRTDEVAWQSAFLRWVHALQAPDGEGAA